MADTRYLKISRPGVGEPFDKGDQSFDPSNNVDILDEIDARVSEQVSYLALQVAKTVYTGTADIKLGASYGNYVTDGYEVYWLGDFSTFTAEPLENLNWVTISGSDPYYIIAVGDNGYVYVYDWGQSQWSEPDSGVNANLYAAATCYNWGANSGGIAAGAGGVAIQTNDSDGSTWNEITSSFGAVGDVTSVDVGGVNGDTMAFAAIGSGDTTDVIYTSDGSSFTRVQSVVGSGSHPRIMYDGLYWVVADGPYVATSTDLSNWVVVDLSASDPEYVDGDTIGISRLGSLYVLPRRDYVNGVDLATYILSRDAIVSGGFVNYKDDMYLTHIKNWGLGNFYGRDVMLKSQSSDDYKSVPRLMVW